MDIVDVMQVFGCFGVLIASFILFVMRDKLPKISGQYTQPEWNFYLKRWYAQRIVKKIKQDQHALLNYEKNYDNEHPKLLPSSKSSESQMIYGCDMQGNYLLLKFTRFQHRIAELWIALRLEDGTTFTLPEHPDTRVCNATPNKFEAHGLILENLVPYSKWRIRFSGLLRRGIRNEFSEQVNEHELEFVKFNFFWNACSVPQHWPYDWSPKLMATALALEPWRDGNWKYMLNKADSGGYDQFGALKGRVFIQKEKLDFTKVLTESDHDRNFKVVELNLPGIRQRRWGPSKTAHLHRTASFVGVLQDGVVFELGAFSSKTGLTHCQFGNFRTPNGKVFPIDWSDFHLSKFGEDLNNIPSASVINLKANGKKYQLMTHFRTAATVPLMGGNPFDWIEFCVPIECSVNGIKGCGMAMFWYPKRHEKYLHYRDFLRVKRVFYRHDVETQKPVIKLSETEAQNPKMTSEQGALMAILEYVAHDRKSSEGLTGPKSDHLLKALVNEFPPDHVWQKRQPRSRSRFSESDSHAVYKLKKEENPFLHLDVDFHPKYIECFEFIPCQGVVLYRKAFDLVLKENRDFYDTLLSFAATKEIKNTKCISDAIENIKIPSTLVDEVVGTLDNFVTSEGEYNFLTTLLNGKQTSTLSSKSTDNIFDQIKNVWMTYYQNINAHKLKRLPIEHFIPAVSIQVVRNPNTDKSDEVTGVFNSLILNDDPRNFLIQFGKTEISTLINGLAHSKNELNQVIVTRNYTYSSYKVIYEEKTNKDCILPEEAVLRIARLCATLEKMLAVQLKIFWQLIDNQIHIIHAINITDNSLSGWELKNEFDSAEMSFELKEAAKDFTPLTISSVVSLMSQSQQKVFNNVTTAGLYRIGKIIRRLNDNKDTAMTIRRFLGINGNDAIKHLYMNARGYRFERQPAKDFLEHAEKILYKERLKQAKSDKEILKKIADTLKESHVLWDYYYNLIALQRSWLYLIFKFICGTCDGMKAEHYEDFTLVTQYFNVRDLTIQKFIQSCKRIGDDFLEVSLSEMKDDEVIQLFYTIVEGNPAMHKPNTVELMANETNSLAWSKQLQFAFDSYMKIKGYNLNSTFNLRFPHDKKRIEHIMNHLVSTSTKFDKFCMKTMLIFMRNVTRKLLEANAMREKFMKIVQDSYRILSMKCQTEDIYYMTQTELHLFIEKNRYEYLERSHKRHLCYTKNKSPNTSFEKDENKDVKVYGNTICPGDAVGFALVQDAPSQHIITEDVPPIILITNNLRKNVGWLPYLRLFKGIVLEADGYFDADAAVCRLVGVPCLIGAKDATSMFKTGDNLVLYGTKGMVSKLMED